MMDSNDKKKPNVCFASRWTRHLAQQALQTLAHRQVQVKLRLPQLPGSGNAECDNAEMLGKIIKKGGGTQEVSGC